MFEIYNKLFDPLDQARVRLSRKRVSWKRALLNGIEAASTKLRQYYSKTQGSLGYLYGKAALLSPNKKDLIIKGPNWDAPYGESRGLHLQSNLLHHMLVMLRRFAYIVGFYRR